MRSCSKATATRAACCPVSRSSARRPGPCSSAKRQLKVEWDESASLARQLDELASARERVAASKPGPNVSRTSATSMRSSRRAEQDHRGVLHLSLRVSRMPRADELHGTFQGAEGKPALEIWVPTQVPDRIFPAVKSLLGLEADAVTSIRRVLAAASVGAAAPSSYAKRPRFHSA